MSVAGLILPQLSAFDPTVVGEGSLDPMGLAAISDRLADVLVPGLRARMQRVRFVTATAVGALACKTLADELPADGVSTAAICFEWLIVEGFVRRLSPQQIPPGVPGSQKARAVVMSGQRLSAATYLKGPAVFGFNGVYKPFAIDAGVVGSGVSLLTPLTNARVRGTAIVRGNTLTEGELAKSHLGTARSQPHCYWRRPCLPRMSSAGTSTIG